MIPMNYLILAVSLMLATLTSGCGPSQKQLKEMDSLLEKSKDASCLTIREHLSAIQAELKRRIR